jgi:hypothetical protein
MSVVTQSFGYSIIIPNWILLILLAAVAAIFVFVVIWRKSN